MRNVGGCSSNVLPRQDLRSTVLGFPPCLSWRRIILLRVRSLTCAGFCVPVLLRPCREQAIFLRRPECKAADVIQVILWVTLTVVSMRVVWRGGRPWHAGKDYWRVEPWRIWVEARVLLVTGALFEGVLSNTWVSHPVQQKAALVKWAEKGKEQDRSRKSGFERAASCISTWREM